MKNKAFLLSCIGATATCALLYKRKLNQIEDEVIQNMPGPTREEMFYDVLNGQAVAEWYEKNKMIPNAHFIFARVTEDTMKMFARSMIPPQMDVSKHLLLSIVDKEEMCPVKYCLVGFNSLNFDLEALLGKEDFNVVNI